MSAADEYATQVRMKRHQDKLRADYTDNALIVTTVGPLIDEAPDAPRLSAVTNNLTTVVQTASNKSHALWFIMSVISSNASGDWFDTDTIIDSLREALIMQRNGDFPEDYTRVFSDTLEALGAWR